MRHTLIIILLLSCMLSHAQEQLRNFGIAEVFRSGDSIFIKKLTTAVINITDGLVTKMRTPPDSARLFISSDGAVYEGTTVWRKIGGVVVPPALVLKETINDTNARITYTGTRVPWANQSWTNGSCAGCTAFLNNDVTVISVVNSSATMTFTGKRVVVNAELRENHGVAKIEIKQGTTIIDSKIVDTYSPTAINAPAQIYASAILPQGTYTVTVSLNSISTGRDSIVLDSFLIFE